MADFKPTTSQEKAINHRGGTLLISAGAGSGKTSVLVQRLLSRICNDNPRANVSDFVIITFTRASAAELRERIRSRISKLVRENPHDKHLRRQRGLIGSAQISTIHSYCSALLRDYAQMLDLPPDFRIIEPEQANILQDAAYSRLMQQEYAAALPSFLSLVNAHSPGRDDSSLKTIIFEMYDTVVTSLNPEAIESSFEPEDGIYPEDLSDTPWGASLLSRARKIAANQRERLTACVERVEREGCFEGYIGFFETKIEEYRQFLLNSEGGWEAARASMFFSEEHLPKAPKAYGAAPSFVKDANNASKEEAKKIRGILAYSSADHYEDLIAVTPERHEIMRLVTEFGKLYAEEKNRRRALDYNDLEQNAVKLLTKLADSPHITREVSARYLEVMVDEYQDVSPMQDLIANLISDNGKKLTLVGDPRQSIYRFRGAEPNLFITRYENMTDEPAEDGSRRVILAENFRSTPAVVNAVNDIFVNIMSKEAGDIDYGEREKMVASREDCGEGAPVEFCVLDLQNREDPEDEAPETNIEAEARYVAARIREMVENSDELNYDDVAILLRSAENRLPYFRKALETLNIPVEADAGTEFFACHEIMLAMSWLSVIDNPRQDIPLIAVMTAAPYYFTADELAAIRLEQKKCDFLQAVLLRARSDEKAARLIADINDYRKLSLDSSIADLIWRVYDDTGLIADVSGWDDGFARRANLSALVSLASDYESRSGPDLGGFIKYAQRMRARKYKGPGAKSGKGVKITTIHSAKGLEYPVVFLCSLSTEFNAKDENADVLYHREFGLGLNRVILSRRLSYTTIAREAIRQKIHSETVSEEMRLLYVAMTRAKNKLIMTAFISPRSNPKNLESLASRPANAFNVSSRNCLASMLYLALLPTAEGQALLGREADPGADAGAVTVRLLSESDIPSLSPESETEEAESFAEILPPPEPVEYAHRSAVDLPSKLTVTALQGEKASEAAEEAMFTAPPDNEGGHTEHKRPDFITGISDLSASERGTAVHNLLRDIDFSVCVSEERVLAEIERVLSAGSVPISAVSEKLRRGIVNFFESGIGKRAVAASAENRCLKEFKFSLLRRACDILETDCEDEILFQGVIDLALIEDGGITIADFKTDRIRYSSDIDEKIKHYDFQLRAYREALSQIYDKPVTAAGLYLLDAGVWKEADFT